MPWARVKYNIVLKIYNDKPECPPEIAAELFEVGPAVKKRWKRVDNNFVPPEPGEQSLSPEVIFNLPPLPPFLPKSESSDNKKS